MYAAYKMSLSEPDNLKLSSYSSDYTGNKLSERFNKLAHKVSQEGFLQMAEIAEDWFPDVDTRVFISHSHADEEAACRLANYLWQEFKIKSFIDSKFWGYSLNLLKNIDDTYCLNQDKQTYSYELRNQSTSHIHMMLATSLTKMMDKCECFLFLESDQSRYQKTQELYTHSVWINYEIHLSSLLRRQLPSRSYPMFESANNEFEIRDDSKKFIPTEYRIDLSNLKQIGINCFNDFKLTPSYRSIQYNQDLLPQEVLDFLYENNPFLKRK